MRKPAGIACLLLLMLVSFLAGTWFTGHPAANTTSGGSEILRYICPMHPEFTSDRPGDAPCCGMRLEPIYADGSDSPHINEATLGSSSPAGTVKISAQQQQLIGVQLATVERASDSRIIRLPGRVAVDERKVYFLNVATDGWVRETFSDTTGGLVGKDQLLATYYAPEFQGAEQAYFYALNALDRYRATGKETPEQLELTRLNIQQAVDGLRNLGMGDTQIQQLERSRTITRTIELRSPASGFVLERNISPGLRFEKGTQLYRIADLKRVWVLADLFQNDSQYFQPGAQVRVSLPHQQKTFPATVSDVLPQFDPVTRTLKLRLECDNLRYELRPDMFVDVELPVNLEPAITVPADAVVNSGLRKTAFVAKWDGFFEPRTVKTGRRYGDRIEILSGLTPGDRVVISGTFLVDSESRMKAAAAGIRSTESLDPVCGMRVDEAKAPAAGNMLNFGGTSYFFCSASCKRSFETSPLRYIEGKPTSMVTVKAAGNSHLIDPVCGMQVNPEVAANSGKVIDFHGKKYYFCAESCVQSFRKNPTLYVNKNQPGPKS